MPPALHYLLAVSAGYLRPKRPALAASPARPSQPGISVVIPSRNGKDLLAAQLDAIVPHVAETIVVDNGSDDGTAAWLAQVWPAVRTDVTQSPLSFAHAVNSGLARARFSHVCLLNNDMLVQPGFFAALQAPFNSVPNLFSSTAQILFPPGVRRQETGKAVMAQTNPEDFPLRCDEPIPGEDQTFVLYGSGGCSLYDAVKLRALGGFDEAYRPAYVEDLDAGYRAWQRGWPSVYCAGAVVEHRHRATTSRYYTEAQLDTILEENYLKFLARAVSNRATFHRLWKQALTRLKRTALREPSRQALAHAAAIARAGGPAQKAVESEDAFLALTNGLVATFPGNQPNGPTCVVTVGRLAGPHPGLMSRHAEVTLVAAPKASPEYQAACDWMARKWGSPPVRF